MVFSEYDCSFMLHYNPTWHTLTAFINTHLTMWRHSSQVTGTDHAVKIYKGALGQGLDNHFVDDR